MAERDGSSEADGAVEMDVEIANGETRITVSGDRDAAVVVRSESGERIYLPPEDFDRPVEGRGQSPYDGAQSPYEGPGGRGGDAARHGGTPYTPSRTMESPGMESTPNGFRILHPEPVTDLRLLR